MSGDVVEPGLDVSSESDAQELAETLLRRLRTSADGLSSREAERRLLANGPNELTRRRGPGWTREAMRQLFLQGI